MKSVVVSACVAGMLLLLSPVAVPAMWEWVHVTSGGCVGNGGGGCMSIGKW